MPSTHLITCSNISRTYTGSTFNHKTFEPRSSYIHGDTSCAYSPAKSFCMYALLHFRPRRTCINSYRRRMQDKQCLASASHVTGHFELRRCRCASEPRTPVHARLGAVQNWEAMGKKRRRNGGFERRGRGCVPRAVRTDMFGRTRVDVGIFAIEVEVAVINGG
jgi:hypothetical protein